MMNPEESGSGSRHYAGGCDTGSLYKLLRLAFILYYYYYETNVGSFKLSEQLYIRQLNFILSLS